jgi:hypothetical protein
MGLGLSWKFLRFGISVVNHYNEIAPHSALAMLVERYNVPKLSHGHGRLARDGNLDSPISWLNPNLKAQWPLVPARC